jgi:hypothetical protein
MQYALGMIYEQFKQFPMHSKSNYFECISSQDFTYNLKPSFAYSMESP